MLKFSVSMVVAPCLTNIVTLFVAADMNFGLRVFDDVLGIESAPTMKRRLIAPLGPLVPPPDTTPPVGGNAFPPPPPQLTKKHVKTASARSPFKEASRRPSPDVAVPDRPPPGRRCADQAWGVHFGGVPNALNATPIRNIDGRLNCWQPTAPSRPL